MSPENINQHPESSQIHSDKSENKVERVEKKAGNKASGEALQDLGSGKLNETTKSAQTDHKISGKSRVSGFGRTADGKPGLASAESLFGNAGEQEKLRQALQPPGKRVDQLVKEAQQANSEGLQLGPGGKYVKPGEPQNTDAEYGKTRINYEQEKQAGTSTPLFKVSLSSPPEQVNQTAGQTSEQKGHGGDGSKAGQDIQHKHTEQSQPGDGNTGVSRERLAQIETATQQMLHTASERFGAGNIERMHIAKDDVGTATAALLLGPEVCHMLGSDEARNFGKRVIVFGVAPMFGMADEAKKQFTEHTKETVHEGSSNFIAGTAIGAVLERVHPLVLGTVTVGAGGAFLHDQLASPEHQARNAKISDISSKIDKASNADLIHFSDQTKTLLGPDLYKGTFLFATGGAGIPEGQAVRTAAKEEASHVVSKIDMKEVIANLSKLKEETWNSLAVLCTRGQQKLKFATADGPPESFLAMTADKGDKHLGPGRQSPEEKGNGARADSTASERTKSGSPDKSNQDKAELHSSIEDSLDKLLPDNPEMREKLHALSLRDDFPERETLIKSLLDQKSRNPAIPLDLDVMLQPMSIDQLKIYDQGITNVSFIRTAVPKEFRAEQIPALKREYERSINRFADAIKQGKSEAEVEKSANGIRVMNEALDFIREKDPIIFKPGIYNFSMDEVKHDFATNPQREKLFNSLLKLAHDLKDLGCETLYLDGSFITRKDRPGDYDACWEPFVSKGRPKNPLLLNEETEGKVARKSEYLGDVFARFSKDYGDRVQKWQFDERTCEKKGIIKIDLRNLQ